MPLPELVPRARRLVSGVMRSRMRKAAGVRIGNDAYSALRELTTRGAGARGRQRPRRPLSTGLPAA